MDVDLAIATGGLKIDGNDVSAQSSGGKVGIHPSGAARTAIHKWKEVGEGHGSVNKVLFRNLHCLIATTLGHLMSVWLALGQESPHQLAAQWDCAEITLQKS